MMKNDYIPFPSKILEVIRHTKIEYTFRMEFQGDVKPGQFFEVSIPKYGEAPISVSGIGDNFVDLTIRRVGKVTNEVFEHYVGDTLLLRGPYGNGFDVSDYAGKDIIVMAGGTGLSPIRGVVDYFFNHPEQRGHMTLIVGFKTSHDILFRNDLKLWKTNMDIMGMTVPHLESDRCVSCGACVKACKKKSVEALKPVNFRPQRDERRCIGCGECVLACPNAAWTRSEKKYYRLTLLGRTGKKNPRLGEDFIKWVDEDSIIKIILNTYDYVKEYIDPNAPGGKEHIGYIVDRTGFEEFKRWALRDVTLPEIAEVMTPMYWKGITY